MMFRNYLMNLVIFYRLKQLRLEVHELLEEMMRNRIMMYMCIYQIVLIRVCEEIY